MRTSRSSPIGLSVRRAAPRKAISASVNSGVNSMVSTGAMFTMPPNRLSTSQAAMSTAPAAPQGRIQVARKLSASRPMLSKMNSVVSTRTPPPRAIRA